MFKRIRESEKYKKLKEMWKNPKTHSLIVLGFWLVFMLVVILVVRTTAGSSPAPKQTTTDAVVNSYEFSYIKDDSIINGQAYNDSLNFYINNQHYYYNKNTYLIEGVSKTKIDFDLNILKITPKLLKNLTSNITPTKTNDISQYLVPLDRFVNLYEIDTNLDLTKLMTYNIIVNIHTKDNLMDQVTLDLTNYMKQKGIDTNYIVAIYYYNINNVSDFTKGYDKIGVK